MKKIQVQMVCSWRRDETNLYLDDSEGVTRRSILLAILKELRFDLSFLRSWIGDETTFIRAFLQGLRNDSMFWLFRRGVRKIWGFDDSERAKNQLFSLWTDLADLLTHFPVGNEYVKYQVREPLWDPQSNFELLNTLSELKEARDGPAG